MIVEDKDLLANEIRSWDKFKYALREQNATLFDQMLKECEAVQFTNAVNSKGDNFAAESLFMVLILLQQRMINRLITKLSSRSGIDKNYVEMLS